MLDAYFPSTLCWGSDERNDIQTPGSQPCRGTLIPTAGPVAGDRADEALTKVKATTAPRGRGQATLKLSNAELRDAGMTDEGLVIVEEAKAEVQEASAAPHQHRRTPREARAKQSEVR